MSRSKSVCYECPDRCAGCHGKCAKYAEERERNVKKYQARAAAFERYCEYTRYIEANQARVSRRSTFNNTMRGEKVWGVKG